MYIMGSLSLSPYSTSTSTTILIYEYTYGILNGGVCFYDRIFSTGI